MLLNPAANPTGRHSPRSTQRRFSKPAAGRNNRKSHTKRICKGMLEKGSTCRVLSNKHCCYCCVTDILNIRNPSMTLPSAVLITAGLESHWSHCSRKICTTARAYAYETTGRRRFSKIPNGGCNGGAMPCSDQPVFPASSEQI